MISSVGSPKKLKSTWLKNTVSKSYQLFSPLLENHWQGTHKISSLLPFRYQMKPLSFAGVSENLHGVALSVPFAWKRNSLTLIYKMNVLSAMIINS